VWDEAIRSKIWKRSNGFIEKCASEYRGWGGESENFGLQERSVLTYTEFMELETCQILCIIHMFEASLNFCDTDALLS